MDRADKRVPVATQAEFVGRRRQAQRIMASFRDRDSAGVLIHGIGAQGKSSLAARIANRLGGRQTVVVHERYDALTIFDRVVRALPPRLMNDTVAAWRAKVAAADGSLHPALTDLLRGPFADFDPTSGARPILLVVDDLEQVLETPASGEAATPVKSGWTVALASVIAAFRDSPDTGSRLLLTSRYTFALTDGQGDDLAARITLVQLPAMDEVQRDKQMRAFARLMNAGAAPPAPDQRRARLEARIKEAAGGNPGLQSLLFRKLAEGDAAAAARPSS